MSYTMDDRDRIQGHGRDDGDMHRGGERWVVGEGESKTFDLDGVERLKVSLLKGRIDVIGHDDESCRLEITKVKGSPVNVSFDGHRLVIANDDKVSNGVLSFLGIHVSFGGVPRTMTARADVSLLVPRDVAAKISTISGDALISGLTCGAKLDTVSGTLLSDGVSGALNMDTVSGKVEARNHHGSVRAKTVGGDVVVSGNCTDVSAEAVSGNLYVDAFGAPERIRYHAVSGSMAVRLDPEVRATYKASSIGGRARIGAQEFKIRDALNFADGPEHGRPVNIEFNAVGGSLKVVRRAFEPFDPDGGETGDDDGSDGGRGSGAARGARGEGIADDSGASDSSDGVRGEESAS